MLMFKVIDLDHPYDDSVASYYRDRESAEKHIVGCKRHDGTGEHPGSEYLAIIEVERESFPCVVCGNEVTSKNPPKYPYCRMCHYVGSASEHIRSEQIGRFYGLLRHDPADIAVNVDHTGGGCFWLSFRVAGEPVYYVATDGEASLPYDEEDQPLLEGGWRYVGVHSDDEDSPHYEGTPLVETPHDDDYHYIGPALSDAEVVAAILTDRKARVAA